MGATVLLVGVCKGIKEAINESMIKLYVHIKRMEKNRVVKRVFENEQNEVRRLSESCKK